MLKIVLALMVAVTMLAMARLSVPTEQPKPEQVSAVLDALHEAASKSDGERYFKLFAADAVFLGTDATERWTLDEFKAFAKPYFDQGKGWTYLPRKSARHISFSPDGSIAWFDELLDNAKYGECRGTGVVRKVDGQWKIAQYALTIPIPNELAGDVVAMIKAKSAAATSQPVHP